MQWLYEQGYCNISFLGVFYSDIIFGKCWYDVYLVFCKKYKFYFVVVLFGFVMKQGYEYMVSVIMLDIIVLVCVIDMLVLGVSKYLQE